MAEDIKRDFTMDEALMLEEGQRFLNQFLENPTDFSNVFSDFLPPFSTTMQTAIDLCKSTDTDEECVAKQHVFTEEVELLMETGRKCFQNVSVYVGLAFNNNKAVLKRYGQPLYENARASHLQLPVLLMQAYNLVIDPLYNAQIIAKGATLAKIQALKDTATQINDAVQIQIKSMGTRNITTQQRTINLNALWAMMVMLSDCSKQVYIDNPAMWKLYLLYPDVPPTPPAPVPPGATV